MSPPPEKVGGHVLRVPHPIAPMRLPKTNGPPLHPHSYTNTLSRSNDSEKTTIAKVCGITQKARPVNYSRPSQHKKGNRRCIAIATKNSCNAKGLIK